MSTRSPITPEFLTLKEAAIRTGFSVFTFREKIASGELPAYRISEKPGSSYRVRTRDVDALMKPVIPEVIYADRAAR
ncbi:MAG: excisionase family DNA-binding protein [Mycobacterium sp.]|nr:excisionase family DNA-binding protein [Mycobacterium sp.]